MKTSAILFASLLAVGSMTANAAYAKGRHHHYRHHERVPTPAEMNGLGLLATLSLFTPIPITIVATSAADHAAAEVMKAKGRRR